MNKDKDNINNEENVDLDATIVGKEADSIMSDLEKTETTTEINNDLGDTKIIDISEAANIDKLSADDMGDTKVIDVSDTVSSENDNNDDNKELNQHEETEDEDDFPPVIFSREDILGDESERNKEENKEEEETEDNKELLEDSKTKVLETMKKFKKPVLISIGAVIFIFAALYIGCIITLPSDTISKNVYIESLDVGGLTYNQALEAVTSTYLFEDQKVTLSCKNQTFEIDGKEIGLTASPEETTAKAFEYAKSGNKALDGLKALKLLFVRNTIVPVAAIDETSLDDKLWQFGVQVYGELVGHYVEVRDNNEATIWPGHTGFDNDISTAKNEVLEALKNEQLTNIQVTLNSAPPQDITVEQFDLAVYKDPVDAYYEVNNGEVTIVPEQNGRYIDKEKVAPMLATVKEGVDPVVVPWETAYANITASMLQEKLFNATLASYSTYYGSSTANRSANVARASSLLNGAVVAPGGIFSFNDRVGQRTTYNGFYTAPEYVNGETVDGIGGGTCQVSTTLYSAVLYAGLDIVSRTNHMFTVSYAPLGQDATVADSGVDFQFQNNTNYPIKIKSYTDGASIYVDIIGTAWEPQREVKLDHSVSNGSGGTYVYSKRYIYENGECIAEEELPSSYYKAHNE